jgi:cytochrome b561
MKTYARPVKAMHWIVALVVGATLLGGLTLGLLGFEGVTDAFGAAGRDAIYEYHKTGGLIIFALMLLRIFFRRRHGKPAYDPPIADWERRLSGWVQYALYAALVAMPVIGWAATDALDYPVEFFSWDLPQAIPKSESAGNLLYEVHETLGWAIVGLLGLHIGGALRHLILKRDQVFRRMWPI